MCHLISVNSGHVGAHSYFLFEKDLAWKIVDKIVNMRATIYNAGCRDNEQLNISVRHVV